MIYDGIIIGAGASGLTAAVTASRRGKKILLLEKEEKVGAKLLMTGNGKCNLSNTGVCPERYNRPDFVRGKLLDLGDFFRSLGILTKEVGGRLYPYSESALTVVNALRKALPKDRIEVSKEVSSVRKEGGLFVVDGAYRAKKVALCTGSAATKGKASYALFEPFGHRPTPLRPSIVPLVCDTTYIKGLNGLRAKAKLTLIGQKSYEEEGEILFREKGISGICAMSLSTRIAREPHSFSAVKIDFAPDKTEEELAFYTREDAEGVLPKAIAQAVESYARKKGVSLPHAIKNFFADAPECGPISGAQAVCGGLKTDEFDDGLMSKFCSGLYAGGEVLDVDGECGGYNLHFAFSSGIIIGNGI